MSSSGGVLVVGEAAANGALRPVSWELLTAARSLADTLGGTVTAVVSGVDSATAQAWGSAGAPGGQDDALAFKCSDLSFEMLTKRKGIAPAPYLARAKWVQVEDPKAMDADEVRARLSEAHRLILEKLPKKTRAAITG